MTWVPLLLSLVLLAGFQAKVKAEDYETQRCGYKIAVEFNFTDNMLAGQVVRRMVEKIKVKDECDYMEVDSYKTIVLKKNLTSVCVESIDCMFQCVNGSNTEFSIIGRIERSFAYTLTIGNNTFQANATELTPNGTHLKLNQPIKVLVAECENFTQTSSYQKFHLKNGYGMLRWQAESSTDSLIVAGDIDYERNRSINVDLMYTDTHLNRTATVPIHVTVLDVDDQNPIFKPQVYNLSITEENKASVNNEIPTTPEIHAYDQDFGLNTTVTYTIKDQQVTDLFTINNTTGRISVTEVLDREKVPTYTLILKAAQIDNPYRSATATVSVSVLDIDDNPPKFDKDQYLASVNEHAAVNTTIVIVTATDPDEGVNAEFNYTLSNTSLPVAIDRASGRLIVADPLAFDRESYKNGIMNVQVKTESLYPGPHNTTTVIITLEDINDNNPNFTEQVYSFTALDVIPSDIIGMVFAEDADKGPNANVTYSIVTSSQTSHKCNGNQNSFPFAVGSLSGNVTVTELPSCELYTALVVACDNPDQISTRRCSTVSIRISHNSTSGVRNTSQEMSVLENSPNGTTVGVVKCTGAMGNIQNDDATFRIDSSSGLVSTNKLLNRENTSLHIVLVNTLDDGQPICHTNITIRVTDVNDNAPLFLKTDTYIFNLKESDIEIGSIQATDTDEGENAEVMYYLQNQRESRFIINSTNGGIFPSVGHTFSDIDIVRIMVVAEDNGAPKLKTTESVYILPKDQPENLIPIKTPLSESQINAMQPDIERDLLRVTGIQMKIKDVNPKDPGSMIQLEYINNTLERRAVLSAIVDNYEEIRSMFYPSQERPLVSDDGDGFGIAEIGLIVMAAVILIVAIAAIVIIRKQCNRAQSYRHLYESLTRNSSIYESQEIRVKMDDDGSQFNGLLVDEEVDSTQSGVVSATVNPAYEPDDPTVDITEVKTTSLRSTDDNSIEPKSLDTSETSVDDAIDSLEQLSDRLEQEDGGTAVVYDHVNTSASERNEDGLKDDSSANSLDEPQNVYVNEAAHAEDSYSTDNNGRPMELTDSNDSDDGDEAPNDLAQRILQSRSRSPVMSRRNDDDGNDDEEADEDTPNELEEPNPDYDIKQVRFSTQVLDAAKNKIEPLKESKDATNDIVDGGVAGEGEESMEADPAKDVDTPEDVSEHEEETGGLMLEEEINSPVDFLTDPGEFYFGAPEETTHF